MTMNPLETKEIRGLSIKALGWLLGSTIMIVSSVMTSYFLIKNDIVKVDNKVETVRNEKVSDDKYNDLRLKVIEAQVNTLGGQVDVLRTQVGSNSQRLNQTK
jgi:hypothetical protein